MKKIKARFCVDNDIVFSSSLDEKGTFMEIELKFKYHPKKWKPSSNEIESMLSQWTYNTLYVIKEDDITQIKLWDCNTDWGLGPGVIFETNEEKFNHLDPREPLFQEEVIGQYVYHYIV